MGESCLVDEKVAQNWAVWLSIGLFQRHISCFRLPRASASLGQPRSASADQPRGPRWHPGHTGLAFDSEAYAAPEKRTVGDPGETCELAEPPNPSCEGEPLLASGEGGMKLVRAPDDGQGEGWGWVRVSGQG